ncbi:hypothetical protein [Enterococcus faecium]|uniref:hypothetical protein n=1 Tax=Enterococcus faecium TaxID=1352 RepID=UPI001F447878|nr:hypothetical protein [Enterococcus faecium]MCE5842514.1 hypothetical protein [Enterococcus faecium]MCE5845358.1 hypothetical protein [Enterococcus faecium]MCE5849145.1 hypothetical protein [Enterococcus faecium]MCE5851188.1 hypothetical protein [Enterococcus faecium]MCE5855411.1 hypothetical protein [Enterococcus faecium]
MKEIEGIKKRNQERLELLNENRNRMFSYYESMRCLNKSRSEIIESSKYKQLMEERVSLIQEIETESIFPDHSPKVDLSQYLGHDL